MKSESDYKPLILTLNLPPSWIEKLNQIAKEKEQNIEKLVIELLGQTLASYEQKQELSVDQGKQKDSVKKENTDIDDRLKQLEAQQEKIADLEERIVMLEKLMDSLQRQVTIRDHAGSLPAHLIDHSDDDVEDEPDEILTDFLD